MEHVQLSADLVSAQHTGNRANVRLGVTFANVGVLGSVCTSGHYCEVVLVTLGVTYANVGVLVYYCLYWWPLLLLVKLYLLDWGSTAQTANPWQIYTSIV